MAVTERLDRFQQKHPWAGFPLAVLYKYFDDFGSYLAALPGLSARRGVIVNVSSIGAQIPAAGPVAYNAASAPSSRRVGRASRT